MAIQKGILKLEGKVGNVVFYDLNGKLVSRSIGEVDIEKMQTAPQYEATRKNQSEFAVATKAGQLFRQGLIDMTKGYTSYAYPIDVMRIMMLALRRDVTQPEGQKQINNGLKNTEVQRAFRRLNIFSKRNCKFYKDSLLQRTSTPYIWKLDHALLYGKGVKGDQMTVKLGYLHIDFEDRLANYEAALCFDCHRNEKINMCDLNLPKSNEMNMPWTFIIMQVWREGNFQEPTGLTFMSVLDVIENKKDGLHND